MHDLSLDMGGLQLAMYGAYYKDSDLVPGHLTSLMSFQMVLYIVGNPVLYSLPIATMPRMLLPQNKNLEKCFYT